MRTVAIYHHELFKISEPFIAQQALALKRYRPIFVGERILGPVPPGAIPRTIPAIHGLTRLRYNWLRDPRPYEGLLAPNEASLIHAHFGIDGVYAQRLAQRLKLPLVVTFHGFDATRTRASLLLSGNPKWISFALRRRSLTRKALLVLCVSEYLRGLLLRKGFSPERTRVHYTGIDASKLPIARAGDNPPRIIHVARLTEKKGTATLLDALAHLHASGVRAELEIIGDGPLRKDLEARAKQSGIAERVHFRGTLKDYDTVLARIRDARVLCVPSQTASDGDAEGLPMVLLEAQAQGIPVVATRHSGIPEAVQHDRGGFLTPERDVVALSSALERLLTDPAAATQMGRSAATWTREKFDLARQTQRLEALYDECQR